MRKRPSYPSWRADVATALSPILAGFGLAWLVNRFGRRELSVTKITHSPTPSL
jgi:hypothetical protein